MPKLEASNFPVMNKAVSTLFRSEGNKKLAVALLGFAGAKDAHIQKYAQIYRDRGHDTVHFTSLLPTVYNMKLKETRDVSPVIDHLKEVLSTNDLAVHSFSMNGVFTMCSIELQHPELSFFAKTKGIFFDSAPVDLGFKEVIPSMMFVDNYHRDILESGDESLIKEYRKQKRRQALKLLQHYTILPFRRMQGKRVDDISAYDYLLNHPNLPHVLSFVYSKADVICDYRSIQKFATYQEKHKRDVEELFLTDSPHVDHYRKYPKEYLKLVDRFLENIEAV